MKHRQLTDLLLASDDASVICKVRTGVLDEDPNSRTIQQLRVRIRKGRIVKALLSRRDANGRIASKRNVYDKWQGAHWVFAALADIGYPEGDATLEPLRDQVFEFWLRESYFEEFEARSRASAYGRPGVPVMEGRHRRCASQQGNALLSAARLGLLNDESKRLVERLLYWQWPDGGWNCDKNPTADSSSFMETVLPMRGLAEYAKQKKHAAAGKAARRAAEVFLCRQLYQRQSNGKVISPSFVALHYPNYWHYDVLAGLTAMAEMDLLGDRRCTAALDLLEAKELPAGGWPAEARYYKTSRELANGNDYVDWGGASKRVMNPWVTADALRVLHAAGRR